MRYLLMAILFLLFVISCGKNPVEISNCEIPVKTVDYTPTPITEDDNTEFAKTPNPTITMTASITPTPVVVQYSTGAIHPADVVNLYCPALRQDSIVKVYFRYSLSGQPWTENQPVPGNYLIRGREVTINYSVDISTFEVRVYFDPTGIYSTTDFYLINVFIQNCG